MAVHNLNIIVDTDFANAVSVSPSTITVAPDDTVNFNHNTFSGTAPNVVVSGFDAGTWDVTTNLSIAEGSSSSRDIAAGAGNGSDVLTFSATGYASDTATVTVSASDTIPDAFSFNDVTEASPSTEFTSNLITVTGIDAATAISISGNSAQFSINGGAYTSTATTVNNNDNVRLKMNSSSSFSTTVNTTLDIGGVTDTWSITTKVDTQTVIVDFPITSGTLKLTDIIAFFGGDDGYLSYVAPKNLRAYLKGGSYVPDITENVGIPTSGTLNIRDFLGSATELEFTDTGSSQVDSVSTTSGAQSLSIQWSVGGSDTWDPDIGFGSIIHAAEFKWTLFENIGGSLSTGVTISAGAGTWAKTNKSVTVTTPTVAQNNEAFYTGYVKLEVRHQDSPTQILTTNLSYSFGFIGS